MARFYRSTGKVTIIRGKFQAPTVTTNAATSVASTTATGNGSVDWDGASIITERGFCWSTSINPTTSDSKVIVAGATGTYSGSMTSLLPSTTYHYRAYAINAIATSYGADTTFGTAAAGSTVFRRSLTMRTGSRAA